jgi:hypothetical protein
VTDRRILYATLASSMLLVAVAVTLVYRLVVVWVEQVRAVLA